MDSRDGKDGTKSILNMFNQPPPKQLMIPVSEEATCPITKMWYFSTNGN